MESGTPFICSANTIRSGSATLIKIPIIKVETMMSNKFLLFTNDEPICSPIGIKETSTPKLNKVIPNIMNNALTKNKARLQNGMDAMVICKRKTRMMIGMTEKEDSFSFAMSNSNMNLPKPP